MMLKFLFAAIVFSVFGFVIGYYTGLFADDLWRD